MKKPDNFRISNIFILMIILLVVSICTSVFAQDVKEPVHKKHGQQTTNLKTSNDYSKIIRKGVINLKAIDKNKDGKVFQDQMDWNVISDNPGKCPLCKMTLKEVTLDEASSNLVEHGFKVKKPAAPRSGKTK